MIALGSVVSSCAREAGGPSESLLRIGVGVGRTARAESVGVLVDVLSAEALFRREWSGRITPHLVSAWRWEADGQRLWLQLKDGLLFQDGSTVTADAVATSLQSRLATTTRRAAWGFGHVLSIDAIDARTVALRLSQPDLFLLAALSDTKIVHPTKQLLSTGPFQVVSPEDPVEANRFEGYHGGSPAFHRVQIRAYDTQRSAWAALLRREIDAVQEISRESVEFTNDASEIRTFASLQPFYISMVFNHRHPLLSRRDIRQALSASIDRDEVIAAGMAGRGRPTGTPVWPFHWALDGRHETATRYDASAARALFDNAQVLERRQATGRPASRFELRCLVYGEDPQYERIALLIQRQLHRVGVNLIVEMGTMKALTTRIARGDFESYIVPTNASRTLERLYRSWHSHAVEGPAQLNSGYIGADEALDRLRSSLTDDGVRDAVRELADTFEHDVPAAFIAWLEVTRAVSTRVSIGGATERDPFSQLWQWRPATSDGNSR